MLLLFVDNNACVSSSSVIDADIVHQRGLDINEIRTRTRQQYIYPDIKFSCNGTIAKWIYGAEATSGTIRPELQIWRQTGQDTYTKIGFSSVTANATASPNAVHEYYPETTLQFQQGDILGVYYPDSDVSNILIYAQRESGSVNYRIQRNKTAPNTLTISDLSTTGNDFPLVSVVISKSSITMTTTTSQDPTTMVSPNRLKIF